ncbi:MAG: hypothetical protein J7K90_04200 [Desulfuromusa sp.]|nr:hypothetical protein [Desulfuromusa sp.]
MGKRFVLLLIVSLFVIGGCAGTKLVSSWSQPGFSGPTLKRVLVLAVSNNEMQRRLYEDSFVEELQAEGVDAIASYTQVATLDSDREQNKKLIKAAVAKTAADGVLVATLVSIENDEQYIPGSTVYVPGRGGAYGMYGFYGYSYGVIHQPSYTIDNTTVKLHATVFSAKTGEMLWAGDTRSLNPDSAVEVIHENIELINAAMKKAGLL